MLNTLFHRQEFILRMIIDAVNRWL